MLIFYIETVYFTFIPKYADIHKYLVIWDSASWEGTGS